jgi:hypothetical protein
MGLRQATADPFLSPAEVVALRFPDELMEQKATEPTQIADIEEAAVSETDETIALLFSPYPTYSSTVPPLNAQPTAPAEVRLASLPQPEPAPVSGPVPPSPAQLANAAKKLTAAAAAPRGVNTRPGAVLSEGQIASIKQRLKLTPDQQQMWPAVEGALRGLTYAKKNDGHKPSAQDGGSRLATIDPYSSEVRQLTSVAFPLIMSFSDDQKRELHVLAHVAGLEQLVPKF